MSGRLSAAEWRAVLRLARPHVRVAPAMIALGIAASLAETTGITLVVVFLYAAMGHGARGPSPGGPLGLVSDLAARHLGGGGIVALTLGIFALIAAKAGLSLAYDVVSAGIRNRLSERVRNALHRRYLHAPYADIRRHDQGTLLNVLATASWSIADGCMSAARVVINACSVAVFGVFLFAMSWRITCVAAIGSLMLFAAMQLLSRRAHALGAETRRVNHGLAGETLATLQGMRTIRAFGQERRRQASFESASADARAIGFRLEWLYAMIQPTTEIGYFALLCVVVALAQASGISFATTLACVALLYRLQPHLRELEGHLLHVVVLGPDIRSVLALLDCGADGDSGEARAGDRRFSGLREGIRFDRVAYTHPGSREPALADASFTIAAGGRTVILGDSGAGKTTIVNLLLRLYRPDAGAILVDGVPLDRLARGDWLGRIAVAGQDVELIEGTVADNIRLARPDAAAAALRAAADVAGALDFIDGLPDGIDSWIGQQGLNLSGGQRQRIGIARAVLCDPDLLILDEATNALDAVTEARVAARLDAAFAGRTMVIVTHRAGTARPGDHVVRVQQGGVSATAEAGRPGARPARVA
ncbi:ABC transporter ATP-binding protein [Acidisphaera rubrifaciens]|uniref:ATP-binding protein n=1 Tax=Acidisphaera rubrifaciens HS-AP3 TaxID=1231350 RepID=A0A0D6P3J1_9PROT|nr:ABC transporter ATP-binding protein [Acidisphaera rubrifaciens]GAN75911.1 ATP-binding protein [Acidisphaera rubrifaciens HS-AP3]